MPNAVQLPAAPIVRKYTMAEFWESLYWDTTNEDEEYDGFLHICSTINGTEVKIPMADIVHAAAKVQNKIKEENHDGQI